MEDIIKIIFGVTTSIGLIGCFILFIIKISVEKIAEALEKKYTLKFDKEIEKYKSKLEGKNYITKTQFDIEFKIYRELTKSFFDMFVSLYSLVSPSYERVFESTDDFETAGDIFMITGGKVTEAQNCLHENRAFINENLYKKYEKIFISASNIYEEFKVSYIDLCIGDTVLNDTWRKEKYEIVKQIEKDLEITDSELRDYLHSLKIID